MSIDKWYGIDEAVALKETGSFSAAAKSLGVSTSHVSRAIATLEERLNTRLFLRSTRSVSLTDKGNFLIDRLKKIVLERDQAFASMQPNNTPNGIIRFSCPVALGERFILPLCAKFSKEYRDVSFDITFTNSTVNLIEDRFDLVVRTGFLPNSGLVASRIASRPLKVCGSPTYFAENGVPKVLDDLKLHDCIGGEKSWHFKKGNEEIKYKPSGRFHINSGRAALDLALKGLGLCQLPDFYVAHYLEAGALVSILEEYAPEEDPLWIVFPHARYIPPKIRLFVDLIRKEMPALLSKVDEQCCAHAGHSK